MKRRAFLSTCAVALPLARHLPASDLPNRDRGRVLTVTGPVAAADTGMTLVHEHVLVDFVGADGVSRDRYDPDAVFETVLPHLVALRERGCRTLFEATPAYLGRDPALLRRLSEASGVRIVTNTGYYGAARDKHVPAHAYEESPRRLAAAVDPGVQRGHRGDRDPPGLPEDRASTRVPSPRSTASWWRPGRCATSTPG